MNLTNEEFFKESLKFLDYFGVKYDKDTMYMDSGGNSVVMNNGENLFHKIFIGYSINTIIKYVAERLGKKVEYLHGY